MPIPRRNIFNSEININDSSTKSPNNFEKQANELKKDKKVHLPENSPVSKEGNTNNAQNGENTNTTQNQKNNNDKKQIEKKKIGVRYSHKAKKDGFDFSSLSEEEQKMSNYLYVSEEAISNYYLAYLTINKILENDDSEMHFNYGWGFPKTGGYLGYILDCKKSNKPLSDEYIIEFLVTSNDIRHIKFSKNFSDPIYNETKSAYGFSDSLFKPLDLQILIGRVAIINIKNIELKSGNIFSKIERMHLLNEKEINVLDDMIRLMFEQSKN